jgi:hypothetical protein
VVLVPGDESPWLDRVATAIAAGRPSATLLVNGGSITYDDVERSLASRRPVLVLAGTGRAADEVTLARAGGSVDPRARRIAGSALVSVLDVDKPGTITDALLAVIGGRP